MKTFNDLAELSNEEITDLLKLADRLDKHPEPQALQGKVLSLLFLSPSLRTLASFQAAMTRLGGGSFVISPDMSIHGLETRPGIVMDGTAAEHINEAVPVIASYGDAIGIRAFAERKNLEHDMAETEFHTLTSLIDSPWINMESAMNHPCQNLADWKTLDDLAVPATAARRGMDVTVLRPEGFELPEPVMQRAKAAAEAAGGSVQETDDRAEAMEGAHIIYAKSWSSTRHYGDRINDKKLRDELVDWCVDEPWFDNARDDCRFMHCLPVRRGVVVADAILDGPRSVVIHEARNRMLAQMAVLHRMLGGGQ
jgi:N-acetylornithine carbamoyltransferase